MPLDLQIIRAREFVRMGGQGEIDLAASRAALAQLAAALRRRRIDRALLDVRDFHTKLTPQEVGALVQMFREIGFSRGQRLALLYAGDALGRARLFAFISILRGWTVRAFGSYEKALDWLALSDALDPKVSAGNDPVAPQTKSPRGRAGGR